MSKELFKPNVNEDLNRLHNVTLTEGQISTILYIMEGYLQGSDDNEDTQFTNDCDKIFFELEGVVDKYYAQQERIKEQLEEKVIAKDESVMASYNFDEGLYGEIIKDWNYRFPKFSYTNYPNITDTK